jgi:phage-related protein
MTTTALPLPNKIALSSDKSVSFRAISSQFGDGYQQIAPNGINVKVASWTIEWGALTLAERDTVESILDSVGSWGILTWTPTNESVQLKFRMTNEGYTRNTLNKNGIFSISCKLMQVFDI